MKGNMETRVSALDPAMAERMIRFAATQTEGKRAGDLAEVLFQALVALCLTDPNPRTCLQVMAHNFATAAGDLPPDRGAQ